MRIIRSALEGRHATHPAILGGSFRYWEVPERGESIARALSREFPGAIEAPAEFGMGPILAVHDPEFVEYLRSPAAPRGDDAEAPFADTFPVRRWRHRPRRAPGVAGYYAFDATCPIMDGTWEAAYAAAQCALTAAGLVRGGERIAYALCRPPGHHAARDYHGGFCYLNNAAIAAVALKSGPDTRAAILDIDYHHGNGTQDIFYRDPSVLFCSLHADPDDEYPYYWGGADEEGEGPGLGANRNWPLPIGIDDSDYLEVLDRALAAIADFAPSALVVSAGFDLMQGDPVAPGRGFRITPEGLRSIARGIAGLGLPIVVVQEGGYRLDSLGEYAATFLKGLADR